MLIKVRKVSSKCDLKISAQVFCSKVTYIIIHYSFHCFYNKCYFIGNAITIIIIINTSSRSIVIIKTSSSPSSSLLLLSFPDEVHLIPINNLILPLKNTDQTSTFHLPQPVYQGHDWSTLWELWGVDGITRKEQFDIKPCTSLPNGMFHVSKFITICGFSFVYRAHILFHFKTEVECLGLSWEYIVKEYPRFEISSLTSNTFCQPHCHCIEYS